jgi:hypothetical protein
MAAAFLRAAGEFDSRRVGGFDFLAVTDFVTEEDLARLKDFPKGAAALTGSPSPQ